MTQSTFNPKKTGRPPELKVVLHAVSVLWLESQGLIPPLLEAERSRLVAVLSVFAGGTPDA